QRVAIVAGFAPGEPSDQHGSVEGDQAAARREKIQYGCEIAVADEGLSCATHLLRVEQRQQLSAAVAAPNADDAGNRRIAPCLPKRSGADLHRSGQVALPLEYRVVVDRLESKADDFGNAGVELGAVEG